jgi:hypothetical protein
VDLGGARMGAVVGEQQGGATVGHQIGGNAGGTGSNKITGGHGMEDWRREQGGRGLAANQMQTRRDGDEPAR